MGMNIDTNIVTYIYYVGLHAEAYMKVEMFKQAHDVFAALVIIAGISLLYSPNSNTLKPKPYASYLPWNPPKNEDQLFLQEVITRKLGGPPTL